MCKFILNQIDFVFKEMICNLIFIINYFMFETKKTAFKLTLNAVLFYMKKESFIESISQTPQFFRFHFLSDV
jgi:hypothetical protein